jgi:hypothetical protein
MIGSDAKLNGSMQMYACQVFYVRRLLFGARYAKGVIELADYTVAERHSTTVAKMVVVMSVYKDLMNGMSMTIKQSQASLHSFQQVQSLNRYTHNICSTTHIKHHLPQCEPPL